MGPFPDPDHEGYNIVYPPEKHADTTASYGEVGGGRLAWRKYRAGTGEVNLTEALALPDREGVEYALTWVHAPVARQAHGILAAENANNVGQR